MSHDLNVTSNRFDFVKTPLALAVGMVFAPQVWADDGTNAAFGGDPNGGSRTGIPDLQHVDAKSGSSAITYTAAGDNAGRLDISDNAEAVLSWESFDIGAGKALQVLNSTSEYVLVNQVYNGATTIAGSIDSFGTAGTVVIINTAGVTISDGASIDAANLMISSSGMTNTSWVDGSLSNTGAANFGVTLDALADNGGSANIAISENLSVTGDLVVRAEGSVTIADTSNVGNVQATNIYISSDRGAVTASGNSTLNGTSTLTIDSAPGTTGGEINVKIAATELQTVDAGAAAVTLVASGAITQDDALNTKGGVITIKSDHMVGSSSNPIRVNGTSIDVYGITHGSQTGSNIATDNDIYIRATDSALAVGVLNSDAGNVYISGDQAVSDGDSDTSTLDVIGSTLVISSTGDVSALGTAVSSLQTIGSGSVTISNKADSANGDVSQTGAITLVSGSSTANDEAVSITTAAGNITLGGAFDSGKSSNYSDLTIVTAASGELVTSAGSVKVKDFTVVADEIALSNTANQIEASGTIAIRAATSNRAINLGTGTNGLDLRASELLAFKAGATEMVIGADKANGNKSTGTFTVSGENVESKNALDIFAADANLSTTTTATGLAITGTFSGTGGVTSGNDSTADLVGGAITIDTAGSFGAGATTSIDVTASGVVSVAAGNASNDAADTIYLNSLGNLSLGALTTRNSGGDVNAGDTVSLVSAGDITDGNADAANITAGAVTIDVVAGEGVGTSADYLEVVGPGATNLNFKVAGSDSLTGARFAGLHVQTDDALTLQNDLFSAGGVTLRSSGAVTQNSKNISDNGSADAITMVGTGFSLSGTDLIDTTGAVNLTDTSGGFVINDAAAMTDFIHNNVSSLTLTSTGGDLEIAKTGAADLSGLTESGLTLSSSANVLAKNALTSGQNMTVQANSGAGKVYDDSGSNGASLVAAGLLTIQADLVGSDATATGALKVQSATLALDADGASSTNAIKVTSADAVNLTALTTAGGRAISITSTNGSDSTDDITIGGVINSAATGKLTLTANDDVDIANALTHAGDITIVAHGAGNTTGTAKAGNLYGDSIVTATGSELSLAGDLIGDDASATNALGVASSSLKVDASNSGNGLVKITSASAIRLDTLDTTGSGAVAITTTGGDIVLGNGSGTAIDNTGAGRGALTVTSAANININEAFSHQGDVTLVSATAGKIYGDSVVTATGGALTLRTDEIDDDGDAADDAGALQVVSATLAIDVNGNTSAEGVKITSADAISLTTLDTAGSRTIDITTTNSSDGNDDITIGAVLGASAATGKLTLTANDDVDIANALTHAGDVTIIAHGAGNGDGTAKGGNLYGDSIVTATGSELSLAGDLIGDDASATNALGVASSNLKVDASNTGNGLVKITSASAIRLDTLDTTGSGAVAITTTGGDIVLGNGSGTAIDNTGAGRGALTVTSAANININEAFSHQGDVTLVSATAGKIYGDSVVTATGGALTLRTDEIDDDGDAADDGGALQVLSSTLAIDVDGNTSTEGVRVTSADAIDLRTLSSAGARAIDITTTNSSDGNDDITIGATLSSSGTGVLTLAANDDVNIANALTHAGDVTISAHGAGNTSGTSAVGNLYGANVVAATGSALRLNAKQIDSAAGGSGNLGVLSGTLLIDANGDSTAKNIGITSADAISLMMLDTAGSGTISITTTNQTGQSDDDITIGAVLANSAGTGALTLTANDDINIDNAFTHAGAVTLTAHGAGNTTGTGQAGNVYGDSVVTATGAALTLNADAIDNDGDATNAGALGVVSSSLVIDGDAGTKNVKISSTSSIVTGSVDIENSGGDLELTTTGSTSDITVGAGMLATNVSLTAGRNVILSGEVFAGSAAASAAGNAITIVANGGGSGVGSVTQTADFNNGLAADDISITARTIGTKDGQGIDTDLVSDNEAMISLVLGQVTGDTYVGLIDNETDTALEYNDDGSPSTSDKTLDTVSISFSKDVSQSSLDVDETAFLSDGAGVDALTLLPGNFSSTGMQQLTVAALNTRLSDVENSLGQGWSQAVNVANVIAYIINGTDGVVGLDTKFNNADDNTTLSLTEFKAGQDMTGAALTVGADLYNASMSLDGLATYAAPGDNDLLDAGEVKLRDLVSVGSTSVDTTIANLNTVFAATVASGLTGVTSSGLANLNGGIAVDTNKFTVAANGTVATAGTITANAGIVVDTLTIDGSTITSSGDIILDAATDIILDADGEDIFLKDGTVLFATMTNNSNDLTIAVVGGDISFSDDNLTTTGLSNLDGGIAVDTNKFTVNGDGSGNVAIAGTAAVTGALTTTGLSNLDGGIAVDTNKFTVDGGGTGNTVVAGTSTLTGNTSVAGTLAVAEAATMAKTLTVDGASTLTGDTTVGGALGVTGALTTTGLSNLDGGIAVDTNKFTVDGGGTGNTVVAGTSTLTGDTTVGGALGVTGALTTTGLSNLDGGIAVDTNKFTVDGGGTGNTVVAGTSTLTGNTSVAGTLAVAEAATMAKTLTVDGASTLTGDTTVGGALGVTGALTTTGLSNLDGGIAVDTNKFTVDGGGTGNTVVAGTSTLTGDTTVGGALGVTGALTTTGLSNLDGGIAVDTNKFTVDGGGTGNTVVAGTSTLTGNTSVAGTLAVAEAATMAKTLTVDGASTLTGDTTVGGALGVTGALTTTGLSNLDGGIAVDTNKFTVDGGGTGNTVVAGTSTLTGNTSVAGTLAVAEAATLAKTLTVDGASTLTGNTSVAGNLAVTGTSTLTGNTSVAGTLAVAEAATMAKTLTVDGVVTADAGVAVDFLTIDGTSITSSQALNLISGDYIVLDSGENITLDAADGSFFLKDDAAQVATIANGTGKLDFTAAGGTIDFGNENLTTDGNTDLDGNLSVAGTSTLTGNTSVAGTLAVAEAATMAKTLTVDGASTLTGDTTVGGTLGVTGALTTTGLSNLDGGIAVDTNKFTVDGGGTGNTVVAGTSTLTGNTSVAGTLAVAEAATLAKTLTVDGASTLTGNTSVAGNLAVTGTSTLTGNTSVAGTLAVAEAATMAKTLTVDGASTLTGNTSVAGNLAVTGTSTLTGNTSVAGTLAVAEAATLAKTLTVDGASTLTGDTTVGGALGVTGALTTTGLSNLDGGIAVDTNKFTVDGGGTGNTVVAGTSTLTGNTSVAGTLAVAEAATLAKTLTVDGASTLTGNTSVAGNLAVTGTSTLTGNTSVAGTLAVAEAATLAKTLTVDGASTLTGDTTVGGALGVTGASTLTGNTSVAGNLAVTGTSTLTGNTSVAGTLAVAEAATMAKTLTVDGASTLTGDTTVGGTLGVTGASTLTGNTSVAGNLAVTGTSALTGNTSVAGTLAVAEAATMAKTLTVDGASTLTGDTTVGGALGVTGASTLTGNTSVAGNLAVTGTSTLTGNTSVAGTLAVAEAATMAKTLTVDGASTLTGDTTVGGTLGVTGASTLTGNTSVAGNLAVTGTSALTGNTSVAGTLAVAEAATMAKTLTVDGASTLTGDTTVGGALGVTGASTLTGNTSVAGNLAVTGTSTLTGNTSVAGTLGVAGATALANTLAVTGDTTVGGTLDVTGASTLTGDATLGGTLGVAGAVTFADTLDVTGITTLTTATAASLSATTADIDGGTMDGVTIGTGKIGSVVTLVDANDASRTLATLITTQSANVAQTAVNVAGIEAVADIANRADTKADAIAEFRDSTGAAADAADGSDIVASATVLRAIDATAAKANSETLGAMEDEIDALNADNAGGNSFLTFFRNLFGTTAAGGGE